MPTREDCIDDIAKKTGRERKDVEDLLDRIIERADQYEGDGVGADDAFARARDELIGEIAEKAALRRRGP